MKQMDLDLELDRKRNRLLHSMSLDNVKTVIVDKTDMKTAIYKMIDIEIQDMQVEGTYHYKNFSPAPLKPVSLRGKCSMLLKRMDKFLQKSNFYRVTVREPLKKFYNYFRPSRTINMLEILRLDDKEFVEKVYQEVLGRNPEPEGIEHNLGLLRSGSLNKYVLFMGIYNSDENVMHKRLKWRMAAKIVYRR